MLSPQDIQTKEFPKAVFGGYDMAAVDDFLEELEADYTALYKDNAVLKGKMKVLVDKVEEYRSTEDAMRMALLTAQKMSDDMMAETQKKCDEMIKNAEIEANSKRNSINQDLSLEISRLEAAKAETANFLATIKKLVEEQARFILKADQMTADMLKKTEPAKKADEPVRSPEPEPGVRAGEKPAAEPVSEEADLTDTVRDIDAFVADVMTENSSEPEETSSVSHIYDPGLEETQRIGSLSTETPADDSDDIDSTKRFDIGWTQEDEETTPRPKFKFDDLQFGANYNEGK
jgi:cell division initiation protein